MNDIFTVVQGRIAQFGDREDYYRHLLITQRYDLFVDPLEGYLVGFLLEDRPCILKHIQCAEQYPLLKMALFFRNQSIIDWVLENNNGELLDMKIERKQGVLNIYYLDSALELYNKAFNPLLRQYFNYLNKHYVDHDACTMEMTFCFVNGVQLNVLQEICEGSELREYLIKVFPIYLSKRRCGKLLDKFTKLREEQLTISVLQGLVQEFFNYEDPSETIDSTVEYDQGWLTLKLIEKLNLPEYSYIRKMLDSLLYIEQELVGEDLCTYRYKRLLNKRRDTKKKIKKTFGNIQRKLVRNMGNFDNLLQEYSRNHYSSSGLFDI